jgi:hypothetical protein
LKDFKIKDNENNLWRTVSLPIKNQTFAAKCSKRGNDVYKYRVEEKFNCLAPYSKKLVFYNPKDRSLEKKTRALWITLTYDPALSSFKDAWRNISYEFNRFMSYVRKKFGRISCCRVFESYDSGHPHIHCILLFEETEFKVFRDRKGQFRVVEKEIIAKGWHSFVDVKAISSLGRGFSYQKKYLLKSIDAKNADSKALKTLALCWLFCKRAFSISGKFRQVLADLIKTMHNSNQKTKQITLRGEIIQEYTYYVLGFVPKSILHLKNNTWFIRLSTDQIKFVENYLKS